MRKTTAGLLVGVGIGAVVAYFFRGRLLGTTFPRLIVLKTKNGNCGFEDEPAPVTLSRLRDDKIRWEISNPMTTGCEGRREVCIGNWRLNGHPTDEPPVTNPQGLCRQVQAGGPPTHILANINRRAPYGEYTYDILIDNRVAADPIVKLIL
jgi:hypothetical protein